MNVVSNKGSQMKPSGGKLESKKRKRDGSKEIIPDSPKKAKVHAQRKFAQGAAFNSPGITPIKDRARPPPSAPASGPVLAGKCPNTEDFLTFLCFRRTSILPPKLNFFNVALEPDQDSSTPTKNSSTSTNIKNTMEHAGKQNKKVDKKEESKKGMVQALKKKYQEQRLAKQRGANVTKLVKKVKGKNMMRTRSSGVVENNEIVKLPICVKKKSNSLTLRSGTKRLLSLGSNSDKGIKSKQVRTGLRSCKSSDKIFTKSDFSTKPVAVNEKKSEKVKKKAKLSAIEINVVNSKAKKVEGFSDFSSDDNEPLLAVKKVKTDTKNEKMPKGSIGNGKEIKKPLVKSKLKMCKSESPNISSRPTRKTKEAAAIYMEMITKKLVSPEKNGEDDVSSVDSFPELPNAKRNEQRETEIKAKALANKNIETKLRVEGKNSLNVKKIAKKSESAEKAEIHLVKSNKKKEVKDNLGQEESIVLGKELSKEESLKGYRKRQLGQEKKDLSPRPSTRSRQQEDQESPKKNEVKIPPKISKIQGNKKTGKLNDEVAQKSKKVEIKKVKTPTSNSAQDKSKVIEKEKIADLISSSAKGVETKKKNVQKEQEKLSESISINERQKRFKRNKTSEKKEATSSGKSDDKKNGGKEKKKRKEKKTEMKKTEDSNSGNQRPTRKCSSVDKLWVGMDDFSSEENEFTSDEDELVDILQLNRSKISSKTQITKQKGRSGKSVEPQSTSGKKSKNCSEKNENVEEKVEKAESFLENKHLEKKQKSSRKSQRNSQIFDTKDDKREETTDPQEKKSIHEKQTKEEKRSKNVKENVETKKEPTVSNEKTRVADVAVPSTSKYNKEETFEEEKLSLFDCVRQFENKERKEKELKADGTNGLKNIAEPKKKRKRTMKSKTEDVKESDGFCKSRNSEEEKEEAKNIRKRPVRQCSTREKRWIETDSDSFSFYDTSEDESVPVVFDLGNKKESNTKATGEENNEEPIRSDTVNKSEGFPSDNFSESDEEPLKKKSFFKETQILKKPEPESERPLKHQKQEVSVTQKAQREMPGLHPLKKNSNEGNLPPKVGDTASQDSRPSDVTANSLETPLPRPVPPIPVDSRVYSGDRKFEEKSECPANWQSLQTNMENPLPGTLFATDRKSSPVSSVPNRVEMILHSLKKDTALEANKSYQNEVKVTFEKVPCQPIPVLHGVSQIGHGPFGYSVNTSTFPTVREPISTHGLDLLSEVALPTTPKEKVSSQTERIEKWLKDSLEVDKKKPFPSSEASRYKEIQTLETKSQDEVRNDIPGKWDRNYYLEKSMTTSSSVGLASHLEPKFGQFELLESQKLLKRNLFCAEVKQELVRVEQPMPLPKKALTSVQDLLKLQKERKETSKASTENSLHLKNCKCNSCIVKKGWFKNKPVPKTQVQKSVSLDDSEGTSKPFESLTKAFTKISEEEKNSKVSASIAPLVTTSSASVSVAPSVRERMKEREKKEAGLKNPNAFSPSNESSVYAFEAETEQVQGVNTPFRSRARDSRTSSASKSDEEGLKICEDDIYISGSHKPGKNTKTEVESKGSAKASHSASIAVQVNLESKVRTETKLETEAQGQLQDGRSIEISTQTEVPEEDSDSPMFYIPLQQTKSDGPSVSSNQQLIQGVALKLGTEGPMGPNQRVIMKAKLVTKVPDSSSIKAVVMPQPKRLFDQKNNNPPVGTVQPTARRPRDVLCEGGSDKKSTDTTPVPPTRSPSMSPVDQDFSSAATVPSEDLEHKPTRNSSGGSGVKPMNKRKEKLSGIAKAEVSRERSPSSLASSSKIKKAGKQKSSEPSASSAGQPCHNSSSGLSEAPTFHPTEKDFQDPFEYFDRIKPAAEKFGLCRIVPPANFKPDCKVSDDMRFTAYNQYVHRLFHRWGPNIKEMMAIKKYLATQSISLKQPPWIGGIEIDLPRLYQSVQNCGGLMKVMEKKKWNQVADMMRIPKAAQDRVTKLDDIYCKYLLPYDTLSHEERQKLFDDVEKDWEQRQSVPMESQDEEETEEDNYIEECEECVVKGKNMALNQFYRIARNTMSMWFRGSEPSPREVENEFWKHVRERNHHVCVHSGSIDSSGWGYGFPVAKNNSFSKHPWNLKILTNNPGSVLRSLGPVMGVTVPTLHVGMVFAAFCWYRDPHGLPWIEYLHTGAPKIWYGISDDNSAPFREALFKLLPRYTKKKTIWLPSDTAMIPPDLLAEEGVSLCHTVQEPGQFILVFPRAFTSSICTGYLVSESVYFAQPSWLATAEQVFRDIQESCEPSMFSLEKLLFSIATDSRSSAEVLKQVLPMVWHLKQKEIDDRKTLSNLGLKSSERLPSKEFGTKKKKGRWAQEDDNDYECEVCRKNLYASLVINSQEETVYCLTHAVDLLTRKRHQLKHCKLVYSYTQEEMNELVEKLEQRIETKSQKKVQNKSSGSAK